MLNKMQLQTLRTLVEQTSHERLHALVQSDKVSSQDEEYQFYQELLGELKAQADMKNQPSPLQSLIDELGKEVAELKESIKGIHQISGICAFVYANNIITKIEVLERVIKMLGENK